MAARSCIEDRPALGALWPRGDWIVLLEAPLPTFSATRLFSLWDRLRSSFWFLPATMAASAIALSFVLIQVDAWLGTEAVRNLELLYTFGPEGARTILSGRPEAMQLRYLSSLNVIAAEKNSTIVFPFPMEFVQLLPSIAAGANPKSTSETT